ncbi:hypothetical protein OG552_14240 [Streptomyces sp. NBC_01476]|uniref:hypothetical protein n=1 Tax=Streptomyces sp. NBC_01476 TaxID=2903881 RepID=UPI002E37AF8A|nr:hypothetical protein [Streptomyces sp. NBC_01476]
MGLSQEELGALADGAGRTVIQTIERGHKFKKVTKTLLNVEYALGWRRGSVERILGGEDPLPLNPPEEQAGGRSQADGYGGLPLRVSHTLTEGTTLDTTIVPLTPNADMVVVVKGKPTATPEQLKDAMLAWEEREGYLAQLPKLFEGPQGPQGPQKSE